MRRSADPSLALSWSDGRERPHLLKALPFLLVQLVVLTFPNHRDRVAQCVSDRKTK